MTITVMTFEDGYQIKRETATLSNRTIQDVATYELHALATYRRSNGYWCEIQQGRTAYRFVLKGTQVVPGITYQF